MTPSGYMYVCQVRIESSLDFEIQWQAQRCNHGECQDEAQQLKKKTKQHDGDLGAVTEGDIFDSS